ncbi:hypothetical protein [Nonomuraea soli]|uniref:DUF1877 family protein n=1 Tax=Nonomuraea soli TaxID=1032476 RepID=A0A7W0CL80_9ACTN|nr:hypothetical protein [Nonomuraea soli]MBA2893114.1 hypothetical protein [Nonomuraea soli]
MGVLVDYFLIDSDQAAERILASGPAGARLPYLDCKGWLDDPDDLAAELSGRDPSEFGRCLPVADDEESSGVDRVPDEVVAALAAVDDSRLREYADDELLADYERERVTGLRDLAREAVSLGQGMYRWTCV